MRKLQLILAVTAILFGGLGLGLGNMWLLDSDHEHHANHGHESSAAVASALPVILTLPAHCLFCLEGLVPQPVSLLAVNAIEECPGSEPDARFNQRANPTYHPDYYQTRAPPSAFV